MADYPETFDGFMIRDQKAWTEFEKQSFKPKAFANRDVDVKIECCGVCGSDVHMISGGWGPVPMPLCVGHEVVGRVVRVGAEVSTVKEGDRVGVGAQVWSCLRCERCKNDDENYCEHMVHTYGFPYPLEADTSQSISQGGYASHIRAHEYFVFPIPDEIPSTYAAPLLCAGLTVWAPLSRAKVGPKSTVAIVGLGGLGHLAVLFASALGAKVTVISHSPRKEKDALKLGATKFISSKDSDWEKPHRYAFDLILNTADIGHDLPLAQYLTMCKIGGVFHQVGGPDTPLPPLAAQALMANGCSIRGSHIGNRPECLAMLKLAAEKQIYPLIETIPLSKAGLTEAVTRVSKNDVKYRFVLTDYESQFN